MEFVRQSSGDRLTLVISKTAVPIQTLWTLMTTGNLESAIESLKTRENTTNSKFIGSIMVNEKTETNICNIVQQWAKIAQIDAVIWTDLPAKFNSTSGLEPTQQEALEYLNLLKDNTAAEEYIRRAPEQVNTAYRRIFEDKLGWTYSSK